MNLLVINLDKGIFSPGSASLERLKEYSQLAGKFFVVVWTAKKEAPIVWCDKLFVYPTNSCCRLFYYFDSFRLAHQILRENKIDLIFTQDPFETGLAGWFIAKRNKLKLQIQIHTDFLSPYFGQESLANKARVRLAKFLLPKADGLRVVSERIRESLVAGGYLLKPIFVLPIFVDIKKINSAAIKINLKEKYPQFDLLILTAGRLSPEKNIGLAIEAMAEVVKKYPKSGLVIVGDGPEKKNLDFKIRRLNLQNIVVFEPWTDDLVSYLKSADMFLLTSNYEGWGMAAIEALAAGCPVIMTDVGCAGEVIINNVSGLIIDIADKAALAQAVIKLAGDELLRNKIKEQGLAVTAKLQTKDDYLLRYKNSWEAILAENK